MAAVTINRERRHVVGDIRKILADIDIASDGDTYDTKLRRIESFTGTGSGGNVIDGTRSGGTITWNTDGAETGVLCDIVGY